MKKVISLTLVVCLMFVSTIGIYGSEYTVKENDVLWKIARDNDTSVDAIVEANNIKNKNLIYVGDVLSIPQNNVSTVQEETTKKTVEASLNWELDGFVQAESVLYVPGHEWLYVSNVNDQDVGYISRVSLDGKVDNYRFAEGIPAAVGMAYYDDQIYVASLTSVKVIDIKTGEITNELIADESVMLNDITISPNGDLYVTDFFGGKIYKLNEGKLELWLESDTFVMLNGIFFDFGYLIVSNMNYNDLTGSVIKINVNTKEIKTIKSMENIGAIDGISKLANTYIASNATTGELLAFSEDYVEVLGEFQGGMADISVNQMTGQVYLPYLGLNKVQTYTFK